LFYHLEMRILPVLVSMERRVVCVDLSRMEDLGGLLGKQLEELQEKANEMAGNLSCYSRAEVLKLGPKK
jgi:DNA polymerase I-like protein with 3'-5' exonuclease and polymerase domains